VGCKKAQNNQYPQEEKNGTRKMCDGKCVSGGRKRERKRKKSSD
jgi:hypothetical protein